MKRSYISFSQELIKEKLGIPEDVFIYAADYEATSNSIRLYFTGPVAQETPEGFSTSPLPSEYTADWFRQK